MVVGLVFSVSRVLERAALTSTDPFESIQTWLVGHPLWVAVTVAGLAAAAHGVGAQAREAAAER
ncbi:hypothetical protein [Streptomyces sp. NPDC051001]|uniref:hypothetical protein n=1 Tax=Streptomyces sp. NPDC051001 TaxID=3155795 RepID=UPI00343C90E8